MVTVKAPSTDRPFITKWNTNKPSSTIGSLTPSTNTQIYFPAEGNPHRIDFPSPGEYIVKVYPQGFERIQFGSWGDYGDREKLIEIQQWGDVKWESMVSAFIGCKNMILSATDAPDLTQVTNMYGMFHGCSVFNGNISNWDVSSVIDMGAMFYDCIVFNQPLNNWTVNNVTNMHNMFQGCSAFNQPLNNWTVNSVTDMGSMFSGCTAFNQNLSSWNVSNVTDMGYMFRGTAFNQNLNNWDVSSVTDMGNMFYNCIVFNQPLNNWTVNNVTNMEEMFQNCTSFNQSLNNWDVSNVTDMEEMFCRCTVFNQDLSNWNIKSVVYDPNNGNYSLQNMFDNSGMDCTNYGNTLIGWANNLETPDDLVLGADGINYSLAAQAAHDKLINEKHWTITDAGVDAACGSTVSVTGVSVNPTTATIDAGNTQQLTATVEPTNATNQNVTWSTSDSNIATVDADGLVTGIAPGTATITVTTEDGNFSATCLVTVEESLAPANDLCANAIALNCGDVVTGTNIGATGFDATTDEACGVDDNAVGVWYTFEGNGQVVTVMVSL